MTFKDIRLFLGGMNLDDEDRLLPPTDSREVWNSRSGVSENDNVGSTENIKGMTLIAPLGTFYSGVNHIIGSANDLEHNLIIYFVCNSLRHHCIRSYDVATKAIKDLILDDESILNFDGDHLIFHADVINDLLYWTDNFNPPRKINIERAKKYTADKLTAWHFDNSISWMGGVYPYIGVAFTSAVTHPFVAGDEIFIIQDGIPVYDSYDGHATVLLVVDAFSFVIDKPYLGNPGINQPGRIVKYVGNDRYYELTEQVLDRIKYPPWNCPACKYESDTSYNRNNLRGKLFQFRTQYVCDDYELTTYSPVSKVPLPRGELLDDGGYVEDQYLNNNIKVSFNTGSYEVTKINIAVRSGQTGFWYHVTTIEKYDSSNQLLINSFIDYHYHFYNNEFLRILAQEDVDRPFDYVPQLSACQTIIEKNRLIDANYVEGYDNVPIDINLEYTAGFPDWGTNFITFTKVIVSIGTDDWIEFTLPNVANFYDYIFEIQIETFSPRIIYIIHYQPEETDIYPSGVRDKIIQLVLDIREPAGSHQIACQAGASDYCFQIHYVNIGPPPTYYTVLTGTKVTVEKIANPIPSLKYGETYFVGLVYYDRANRSGGVNVSDDSKIEIPFITEIQHVGQMFGIIQPLRLKWTINHLPPSQATHYQLVLFCSGFKFIQFEIIQIDHIEDKLRFKINQSIIHFNEKYEKSILTTWEFQKGDRMRFIGPFNTPPTSEYKYIDYEILSYNDTTITDEFEFVVDYFDYVSLGIYGGVFGGTIVEIYRPPKTFTEEEIVFKEIGEVHEIINGFHAGGTGNPSWDQDQSIILPAKGIITFGDIYIKKRDKYDPSPFGIYTYFPCEDRNYSDFYESQMNDRGRSNLVLPMMRQERKMTSLRFGGKYIQDTQSNNLSMFIYDDVETLSNRWGPINRIVEVGYTLKILQSFKATSIYIGRAGIQQASAEGQDVMSIKQSVLGTIIPSQEVYGCQNPESVCWDSRNMWFWDALNGQVIRDSPNGMFPISDYKMKSYFRNLSTTLIQSTNTVRVFGVFNKQFDELMLNFQEYDSTGQFVQSFATVFLESSTAPRWKYFMNLLMTKQNESYGPDFFSRIGQTLISFVNGTVWLHDDNDLRNNFYGVQYAQSVHVVSNVEPRKVKTFKAIVLDSNKNVWSADNAGDVWIDPNATYTRGMVSLLKNNRFIAKEGVLYASFDRNMITNKLVANLYDLINGDELRGNVLNVILSNTETTEVVLFTIGIHSLPSEKSG
jgi:hypothetical protein